MLNKELIKKELSKKFKNIDVISAGVIRCENVYKDAVNAVYYVDVSDEVPQVQNLTQYQDTILGADYFAKPGYLQWNFYLLFILSSGIYSKIVKTPQKYEIEKDFKYTRKYIFNESE